MAVRLEDGGACLAAVDKELEAELDSTEAAGGGLVVMVDVGLFYLPILWE